MPDRRRERERRQLADALPCAVWLADADGRMTYANASMRALLGLETEQVADRRRPELVHPEDRVRASEAWTRALASGGEFDERYRVRSGEGGWRWVRAHAQALGPDEDTGETVWVGTCQDLTEELRTATELRESEALVDAVIDQAPIGLGFLDADLVYRKLNRELAEINGVPVEEHLGRHPREVLPTLWPQIEPMLRDILDNGASYIGLDLSGRKPGDPDVPRDWKVNYFPVREDGKIFGVGAAVQDVTAERALARRRELQVKDRHAASMARLAAGVAHDFNNELAALSLTTELLARQPELSDGSRDLVRHQLAEIAVGRRIVEQVLDLARTAQLDRRPLDPVRHVQEAVRRVVDTSKPSCSIEVVAQSTRAVLADPDRLRQVLGNVLLNALDESTGAQHVVVEVRDSDDPSEEVAEEVPQPAAVQIVVADDGVGVRPDLLEHVFEPFVTGRPGGTGLGLAQVAALVEQHGGSVGIESEPGRGTTVTITLPAAAGAGMQDFRLAGDHESHRVGPERPLPASDPGSSAATADPEQRAGGRRILLVEDSAAQRHAMARLLESAGHRVFTAADGRSAQAQLDELAGGSSAPGAEVDVVVTDLQLPGEDGLTLLGRLRARLPKAHLVLCTGALLDPRAVHLTAGAEGEISFLAKPFPVERLLTIIAEG
ncbi:MAG TPA: PAS domain-containing protein [Motilibacteraceae bacterium]|nr:PAS domain-containing protein [Motilibacteraceae bacterium]